MQGDGSPEVVPANPPGDAQQLQQVNAAICQDAASLVTRQGATVASPRDNLICRTQWFGHGLLDEWG
jgi:hypothetical protein